MKIDRVPAGMTPHTDDSSRYGYPPGVDHNTPVDVVIACGGQLTLHSSVAQSFGWQIDPHAPSSPGLSACSAPITHYAIKQTAAA